MTVADMIKKLQSMDPTSEVHLSYDAGDRVHTWRAPAVSSITVASIRYSDRLGGGSVVADEEDVGTLCRVVLLA